MNRYIKQKMKQESSLPLVGGDESQEPAPFEIDEKFAPRRRG